MTSTDPWQIHCDVVSICDVPHAGDAAVALWQPLCTRGDGACGHGEASGANYGHPNNEHLVSSAQLKRYVGVDVSMVCFFVVCRQGDGRDMRHVQPFGKCGRLCLMALYSNID